MAKLSNSKTVQEKFVTEQTTKKRSLDSRVFLGTLIILIVGLIILVKANSTLFLDLIITKSIQQIDFFGFAWLMDLLTLLGNPVPSVIILGSFSLMLFILNRRQESLFLLFSAIGATIISELIKIFVGRPRPDPELINQIGIFSRSDSFPSGHVLLYIGIYGYLLYLCYSRLKKSLFRTVLIGAGLMILVLIGISRVYLGAHWFSDVLGSYLIGSVWVYCVIYLESKFRKSS